MKRDLKSMVELKEFLKNPSPNLKVPVYTENEGGFKPVNKSKGKMTLSKLAMAVNDLAEQMRDGFKRLDAKMDAGFEQVNNRIDRIETRLDYIVKANDLKDLSNSKNK